MGNFWNRYKLDNGRPMSPRQIKRIEVLRHYRVAMRADPRLPEGNR